MPIEIRELIIRAVAAEPEDEELERPSGAGSPPASQEEIVQECVRQVLKILEKQKDR